MQQQMQSTILHNRKYVRVIADEMQNQLRETFALCTTDSVIGWWCHF